MKRLISMTKHLSGVIMLLPMLIGCDSDTASVVGDSDVAKLVVTLSQTRTAIGEKDGDIYPVYWSKGDRIAVNGVLSEEVEIDVNDKSRAIFEVNGSLSYPLAITYPYTSATTATEPIVAFLSEQIHTEGTFAEESAPMCGSIAAQGKGCALKHLAGVLKFSVKASSSDVALQKVVITSLSGAKLSGEFKVDCATASLTPTERTQSVVTYVLPTAYELSVATAAEFYIPIPAIEVGNCTVEFVESSGDKMVCSWNTSQAVSSGVVREFKTITYKRNTTTTLEGVGLPAFSGDVETAVFLTRAMTYNVRNCKGTDDVVDYKRVADAIAKYDSDVVALQELDSLTTRFPGQDVLKNLADYTGMYPTFGAAIDRSGGKYGVGVLTKERPLSHYRVPLPCSSEPRVVLVVELEDYYFCCTHFSLHAEYREQAVEIIIAEAQKLDKPMILAGDLNATRDQESMQLLSQHFHIFEKKGSPNTFPSGAPTKEIDFICLYKGRGAEAVVSEHWVPYLPIISDHRPVVIEMLVCE
ncbi:MAG: endonuclease/exonuclease/phosphatase family protein [Alistipes sp.]|nr:endonuclease/exonuclease/phosphatase family protein [Alistipes sp.]